MTSEQFIKANPTISISKAINILEAHGYAFTLAEYSASGVLSMLEPTIDTQKVFDWISY